jgi:hypothetical protein
VETFNKTKQNKMVLYLELVPNNCRISKAGMYSLVSKVCRHESPLSIEFHSLGLGELVQQLRASWSRPQKGVDFEGNHGAGIETQSSGVLGKVCQNVTGVEESHLKHEFNKNLQTISVKSVLTKATLVAISTESTSFPYMR